VQPPATARSQDPGHSADYASDHVYIYRDTSAAPGSTAIRAQGSEPDERDASYWYDLPGQDGAAGEARTQVAEPTRGPFEPLVSSSAPPSAGRHAAADAAGRDGPAEPAREQAQRLEQIKDFYLTAEAIGEQNVDKHFDELLAQQRELISEYFKQSGGRTGQGASQAPAQDDRDGPGRPAPYAGSQDAGSQDPGPQGPGQQDPGRAGRGEPVIAEPPGAW
jgi:hypothetical protein